MYDSQTIAINVVESTCVVDSYAVVDTPRTPVHNTPCPLHWVREHKSFFFFPLYTSMTLQFYSSLFSIVSLGRNVVRTFTLAKAIVKEDSNHSPIQLKAKLDNGTDFEGLLDIVKFHHEIFTICMTSYVFCMTESSCIIMHNSIKVMRTQSRRHRLKKTSSKQWKSRDPHPKWPHREINDYISLLMKV